MHPYLVSAISIVLGAALTAPGISAIHGDDDDLVLAIIDSGIRPDHYQFTNCGPDFSITWKDFVSGLPDPYDDVGHGTAVASVAVGSTIGESPCTSLLVARVCQYDATLDTGTCSTARTRDAVNWAVANGADVINLSLGSLLPTHELQSVYEGAIATARFHGVLVVVAAGNGAANTGAVPTPSELDQPSGHEDALVVGAAGSNDAPYIGTSSDPEVIQNGIDVLVADHSGPHQYDRASGTSFAAPNVAGIAIEVQKAWRAAHGSSLNVDELENMLKWTAIDGLMPPTVEGYGYVDPVITLSQAEDGMPLAPCDRPVGTSHSIWARQCLTQVYVEDGTNTVRQFW